MRNYDYFLTDGISMYRENRTKWVKFPNIIKKR